MRRPRRRTDPRTEPRGPKVVALGGGHGLAASLRALRHVTDSLTAVVGVAAQPVTPCGGCRQRLREFASDDTPVWVADLDGVRAQYTLGQLLPASFGPDHLERR